MLVYLVQFVKRSLPPKRGKWYVVKSFSGAESIGAGAATREAWYSADEIKGDDHGLDFTKAMTRALERFGAEKTRSVYMYENEHAAIAELKAMLA